MGFQAVQVANLQFKGSQVVKNLLLGVNQSKRKVFLKGPCSKQKYVWQISNASTLRLRCKFILFRQVRSKKMGYPSQIITEICNN